MSRLFFPPQQRVIVDLDVAVHLITNLDEKGKVHRLPIEPRAIVWEERTSLCGWRAGRAGASVRFWSSTRWPVVPQSRLCIKCFPRNLLERELVVSDLTKAEQIED